MAVTKIWPISGKLSGVLRYAENEKKTRIPDLTTLAHDDLKAAVGYASNAAKTAREQQLFVSGINCIPETAVEQMNRVKVRFGKTGGKVAFHAYQSFRPGEVTPEQCHTIGVELARRLWGDRFQVVVATHLNTDCCHNHFVLNSVSFIDGKRYNDCKATYKALRDASDQLCREQGLSVVSDSKAAKTPRSIYQAERRDEPTRYNVMRTDIDQAVSRCFHMRLLPGMLQKMGYKVDFSPNRKHPRIRVVGEDRWVRLKTLGERYTPEALEKRLMVPLPRTERDYHYDLEYFKEQQKVREQLPKLKGYQQLYMTYCCILEIFPRAPRPHPPHPALRQELRQTDKLLAQQKLLFEHQIETPQQLKKLETVTSLQVALLQTQRYKCYNQLRRCNDPAHRAEIKSQRNELTKEIASARRELQLLQDIPDRAEAIKKNLAMLEELRHGREIQERNYEHEL